MKFSVSDPAFPWFAPLACTAMQLLIEVDGEEIRDCIAFDTVEGWADRWLTKNGQPVVMANHELATERVRGVVTVSKRKA